MNLESKAIDKLCFGYNEKKYRFHIPTYQRGYRWDEHVIKLVEDLLEFQHGKEVNRNIGNYYCLQPIVVKKRPELDNDKEVCYEVIDGQQRLITIFILLKVFNYIKEGFRISFERDHDQKEREIYLCNIENPHDIVLDRAASMLERDKNHPSILIWSCGNESFGGENIFRMSEYFRTKDPSRLVHYEGVFNDRRFNATSDMESRMYAKVADIEKYLNENPEKPYISCEYMHAMGNSCGAMHKYIELEDKYDMYQGGFIWDYIDQFVVKKDRYGKEFLAYGGDFDDRPTDYNFCGNGIVYADRTVSPKAQEVKALYQNLKLNVYKNGVIVDNQNLFVDTSGYYVEYTLEFEGREIFKDICEINIKAGEKQDFKFSLPEAPIHHHPEPDSYSHPLSGEHPSD
jgi:hypothetical protein